jgi:3-oxoacyl-[acyl-carrier protein] reductase
MIYDFRNKVAMVCGASSGIGKATAELFAESGSSLFLLSRNRDKMDTVIKGLRRKKGQFFESISLDLSNITEVQSFTSTFFEDNYVDILINNSGGPFPKRILDCEIADYQTVFDQHFLAVTQLTKFALQSMIARKFGRIINVLGTSIIEPIPNLTASAVKSVTANWAKALSKQIAKYNVTINNVLPGPTNTEELKRIVGILAKMENVDESQFYQDIIDNLDTKRIAEPKEIAFLIQFLASNYSGYITGTNLVIDGGYSRSVNL